MTNKQAREEHTRKEQDRELDPDQSAYTEEKGQDTERIRALEAEITDIKKQVCYLFTQNPIE